MPKPGGLWDSDDLDESQLFGHESPSPVGPEDGPQEPEAVAPAEPAAAVAAELPSPGPVPTTPAAEPPAAPTPTEVVAVRPTSTSHPKQWKLLERVSKGPRAKQFPTITELWKGDSGSKQRALKMYLQASEDLQTAESKLTVEKTHDQTITHRNAWLTIGQMQARNFSQKLVCV